jgi:hypothetical protein
MSVRSVKTAPLNTVYDFEAYALGTEFVEPSDDVEGNLTGVSADVTAEKWLGTGPRTWIFVKAETVVTKGQLQEWRFGTLTVEGGVGVTGKALAFHCGVNDANALAPHGLAGVADHTIAAGKYGWIIKKGICLVEASGSVVAGCIIDADGGVTAGHVEITADNSNTIGHALEDKDKTLAEYATCYISLP